MHDESTYYKLYLKAQEIEKASKELTKAIIDCDNDEEIDRNYLIEAAILVLKEKLEAADELSQDEYGPPIS